MRLVAVVLALTATSAVSAAPSSPDAGVSVSVPWEPLSEQFTDLPVPGTPLGTPVEPRPEVSTSTEPEPEVSTEPLEPGCPHCKPDRCPRSSGECPAGAGLAVDPCGCCPGGVCGLPEGSRCYNGSLPFLDLAARALGVCGDNMECVARTDLRELDAAQAEALCVCRDPGEVCGSDNTTYASSCGIKSSARGGSAAKDEPPVNVWIQHRGHCRTAPWIVTPPAPVSYVLGSPLSLECEVKGYPAPVPSWERIGKDGVATALPSDDSSLVVMVRGGPEPFMATSWLQLMALRAEDVGTYICVAANSEGASRAATEVSILAAAP